MVSTIIVVAATVVLVFCLDFGKASDLTARTERTSDTNQTTNDLGNFPSTELGTSNFLFLPQRRNPVVEVGLSEGSVLKFTQSNDPDDWSYAYTTNIQDVITEKIRNETTRNEWTSCCLLEDSDGNLRLSNFTVSMRFLITSFPVHVKPTLLSYALDTIDNALLIGVLPTEISVYYLKRERTIDQIVEPMRWHHLLVSIVTGRASVYWNGIFIGELEIDKTELHLNGYLMIGQEQDSVLGNFVKEQMFDGMISDIRIMRNVQGNVPQRVTMCEPEVDAFTIVKWQELSWFVVGDTSKTEKSKCLHETHLVIILANPVSFSKSFNDCKLFNFSVFSPYSTEKVSEIAQVLRGISQCDNYYYNAEIAWMDLDYDRGEGKWLLPSREASPSGLKFAENHNEYHYAVIFGGSATIQPVANGTEACSICHDKYPNKPFYLIGLCQSLDKEISSFYMRNSEEGVKFHNFYGLQIKIIGSVWILYHQEFNQTLAEYTGDGLPIGTKTWTFYIPIVPCSEFLEYFSLRSNKRYTNEKHKIKLSLSNCPWSSFTCQDGTCVSMSDRCSHTSECRDRSDEIDCYPIKVPQTYNSFIAPAQYPFIIKVGAVIQKIYEVKTESQIIRMNGYLVFEWIDHRIECLNLNEDLDHNIIDDVDNAEIWLPTYQIENAEVLLGIEITAKRIKLMPKGSSFRRFNDLIWEGEHCVIRYFEVFSTHIHCQFDLRMFPFDRQECKLGVYLDNVPSTNLKLQHLLDHKQEDILNPPEFVISNVNFTTSTQDFIVSFMMYRYVSFRLVANYLPTFLLHIIGYGTLRIPAANFQDRGTMSLTTLLVLISLYTETLNSLPITSYVKIIDIWFIFSITFLSLIIGTHLLTCDPDDGDVTALFRVRPFASSQPLNTKGTPSKEERAQNILNRTKYILGVGYLIFVILYFGWILVYVFANENF